MAISNFLFSKTTFTFQNDFFKISARYLAKKYKLVGNDDFEEAECNM